MTATYWNGEPTPAVRGTAEVADLPNFPLYWARELVGQRIPVVQIDYFSEPMFLDDRNGRGWHKVTEGRGSPRLGHRNLGIVPGSFEAT